jgi:glycosyltransferase involved in cell wall biosynthesis
MIVLTMSLDSMLSQVRYRSTFKNVVGGIDSVLSEFDQVVLLTQDSKDFTKNLDRMIHVPCAVSRSRYLTNIISRIAPARWAFFFFSSLIWMFRNRSEISLLVSINVDSPAVLFSKMFGVPCIVYYHYNLAYQVNEINKRHIVGSLLPAIERFAFRNATSVWVTSQSLKQKVKLLGASNIALIPNWVDLACIDQIIVPPKAIDEFRVLFVGRLHPVKQVDLLLKAFRLIRDRHHDAFLFILGEGEQHEALKDLTVKLNLTNSVFFKGNVNHEKVIEMMKLSDVLVLTSKDEGNPRVIIEAMACKVPVVGTDVPGIRDMIVDQSTGYLAKSFKPEDIAQSIEIVIKNRNAANKVADKAYEFISENFSKEIVTETIRKEISAAIS